MQKLLEDLVQKGDILSYNLVDLDENGNPGRSRSGNTERLTLVFPSGRKSLYIQRVAVFRKMWSCFLAP
jgi:hypothetical protein